MKRNIPLLVGGILSLLLSLLHLGMIYVGAEAYEYFRAGSEMVAMARSGSYAPSLVTLGVATVLFLFSLYGFSGSRAIPALPFLRWGLIGIGAIYILRGAVLFLQIPGYFPESEMRDIIFSSVSLLSGILYLVGLRQGISERTSRKAARS